MFILHVVQEARPKGGTVGDLNGKDSDNILLGHMTILNEKRRKGKLLQLSPPQHSWTTIGVRHHHISWVSTDRQLTSNASIDLGSCPLKPRNRRGTEIDLERYYHLMVAYLRLCVPITSLFAHKGTERGLNQL